MESNVVLNDIYNILVSWQPAIYLFIGLMQACIVAVVLYVLYKLFNLFF